MKRRLVSWRPPAPLIALLLAAPLLGQAQPAAVPAVDAPVQQAALPAPANAPVQAALPAPADAPVPAAPPAPADAPAQAAAAAAGDTGDEAAASAAVLTAQAAAPAAGAEAPPASEPSPPPRRANPADPFEGWNRAVFAFNDRLDAVVLEPLATGYRKVVPEPVRRVVGNFFGNFSDAWSAVNHFLQGKPASGLDMTMRVAMNTVFGVLGFFDVAADAGLEKREEDFGQTLGRWGFGAGPYLVWPVLGPSSLRDTVGLPLDRSATPAALVSDNAERAGVIGLNVVDSRARLLDATRLIEQLAFDRYSFVRDAYLARRRSLVYDGDPPETDGDESVGEPEPPPAR